MNTFKLEVLIEDGAEVTFGEVAFYVEGKKQSILTAERVVLNCMQRMSGIATMTYPLCFGIEGLENQSSRYPQDNPRISSD